MSKEQQAMVTTPSLEGNKLPSSMSQVGIITRYEISNYFRSRRFYILLGIALAISALLTFLVAYYGVGKIATNEITGSVESLLFYSSWWGFSATILVFFCAVFFGGDAISGEFQNKTGYFLVGNPIRRSSIYVGKWIAALIASLIIIGIFTVIMIANGFYYFGTSVPTQFGESFLFTLVYLIAALGFTFFFSSLFKSSAMSIIVTAILLLFGFSLIDELVTRLVNIEPWFTLSYGSGIISSIFMSPYPSHIATTTIHIGARAISSTSYYATVPEGLAIMLVYFAVTAVLGLLLFERKEFN
jgi:ABC-2 type transport system permease protein